MRLAIPVRHSWKVTHDIQLDDRALPLTLALPRDGPGVRYEEVAHLPTHRGERPETLDRARLQGGRGARGACVGVEVRLCAPDCRTGRGAEADAREAVQGMSRCRRRGTCSTKCRLQEWIGRVRLQCTVVCF